MLVKVRWVQTPLRLNLGTHYLDSRKLSLGSDLPESVWEGCTARIVETHDDSLKPSFNSYSYFYVCALVRLTMSATCMLLE